MTLRHALHEERRPVDARSTRGSFALLPLLSGISCPGFLVDAFSLKLVKPRSALLECLLTAESGDPVTGRIVNLFTVLFEEGQGRCDCTFATRRLQMSFEDVGCTKAAPWLPAVWLDPRFLATRDGAESARYHFREASTKICRLCRTSGWSAEHKASSGVGAVSGSGAALRCHDSKSFSLL